MEIEYNDEIENKYYGIINEEFEKLAIKNGVRCDYKPFIFIAKEDDNVLGFITGHSYYEEVYISDLIIYEEHRKKRIGSKLVKEVEEFFKNKGFNNINLTTQEFQAPDFYKKCGFTVEFVRKNKENPKLNKYYLAKYF